MEVDGSGGASALLALDGFVVCSQTVEAGEVWLLVETRADRVGCPGCGVRAVGNGRRRVKCRDLPVAGRPCVLVWAKRTWRCREPLCEKKTWSETLEGVRARSVLTERARRTIAERVGDHDDSVAEATREFGVGWSAAMAAVTEYGRPLVDDPDRLGAVEAIGLDETRFLAATREHPVEYVTGFVDIDRGVLLDVVEGRSERAAAAWLEARPQAWLDGIRVAALDPHRAYRNALEANLDNAVIVVDHFHAIVLANRVIDEVRCRLQQETTGHRGRKNDPLYKIRRLLLRGSERLDERAWARLEAGLAAGDLHGVLTTCYLAKELLRDVYAALSLTEAHRRLIAFYWACADSDIPELLRLAGTISKWENEVLAYHITRMSNGPTEAVNLIIEKVRRIGHGFRNFQNYRLRLLLACGNIKWNTQPTTRIRGRQPRFIA